jgi:hypothetical protein
MLLKTMRGKGKIISIDSLILIVLTAILLLRTADQIPRSRQHTSAQIYLQLFKLNDCMT